jgi:hypothetical protein
MTEPNASGKADLWGEAFVVEPRDSHPIGLLKEQAEALTRRTGGLVKGVVTKHVKSETVWASLYAEVPSQDDYMHKILTVSYPVSDDPDNPSNLTGYFLDNETFVEDFSAWLKDVLSSDRVHAIIVNLMRYSRQFEES